MHISLPLPLDSSSSVHWKGDTLSKSFFSFSQWLSSLRWWVFRSPGSFSPQGSPAGLLSFSSAMAECREEGAGQRAFQTWPGWSPQREEEMQSTKSTSSLGSVPRLSLMCGSSPLEKQRSKLTCQRALGLPGASSTERLEGRVWTHVHFC